MSTTTRRWGCRCAKILAIAATAAGLGCGGGGDDRAAERSAREVERLRQRAEAAEQSRDRAASMLETLQEGGARRLAQLQAMEADLRRAQELMETELGDANARLDEAKALADAKQAELEAERARLEAEAEALAAEAEQRIAAERARLEAAAAAQRQALEQRFAEERSALVERAETAEQRVASLEASVGDLRKTVERLEGTIRLLRRGGGSSDE